MNKKLIKRSKKIAKKNTKENTKKKVDRKYEVVIGVLSKHRKGFGFVIPEEESDGDIFIAPNHMNYAMNGDKVAVKMLTAAETTRAKEGIIDIILERAVTEVVGTVDRSKKFGFIIPDDKKLNDDIFISKNNFNGAKNGDKVVAEIIKWPKKGSSAEGRVSEIISKNGEKGGDIKALIRQYNLKKEFPKLVNAEANAVLPEVNESDLNNRRDLRSDTVITIDGADSKDFDDAVSIKITKDGGYILGVHIADVTRYVKGGSPLDKEALKRGNSVYLIDQVVPMLPEALSNGICSLNPNVDRLTLSVDIYIDKNGKVTGHEIYESVINSKARMVYSDVSDMLENEDKILIDKYVEIYPDILSMSKLAKLLREGREARGSLDFDFDEAHITLNKNGVPIGIETAERRTANKLIEEFMLLANETVAEHFFSLKAPFIYRIHEKPDSDKIDEFKRFIAGFGLQLKGDTENIHPKAFNEIIKSVEGKPEENVINTVMLRSMKKAFYGPICEGHFGLGIKYYCHFTSPIRRYPDLMIHRIIKTYLGGEVSENENKAFQKQVAVSSEICSKTERLAQELEREVEKLKKAEYMSFHISEEFEGIISGVASFGFFVEIENVIEGMVRVDDLDDFYDYEDTKYRLIGRRTHKIYGLGDKVSIYVKSVDIQNREINFGLRK